MHAKQALYELSCICSLFMKTFLLSGGCSKNRESAIHPLALQAPLSPDGGVWYWKSSQSPEHSRGRWTLPVTEAQSCARTQVFSLFSQRWRPSQFSGEQTEAKVIFQRSLQSFDVLVVLVCQH